MGVQPYEVRGVRKWKVDKWIKLSDGTPHRLQQRSFRTKAQAKEWLIEQQAKSLAGLYVCPKRDLTVNDVWASYEPICKRDRRDPGTDISRAAHLRRHLGQRKVMSLTLRDVESYRNRRFAETNRYGRTPASSTINREAALLRRILNHAVKFGDIDRNPLAGIDMLREDNIRDVMIPEEEFSRLLGHADEALKPILLVAYDTGLRKGSVLALTGEEIDMREGCIRLAPKDSTTKKRPPAIYLTSRTRKALSALPRPMSGIPVFINPNTGKAWVDIKKMWSRARKAAGLEHVIFHDIRRSAITNARRRGVPESVIMKMSGHKTRSVFDRYNIIDDEDLRQAALMIERGRAQETECNDETAKDEAQ